MNQKLRGLFMGVPNGEVGVKADSLRLRRVRRQLRKKNRLVQLLRIVTSVTNESATVEEALQATLDAVCALTGWPVGHALLRADDKDEVASARLWHLEDAQRFRTFQIVSEALTFGGGIGLPGRVLSEGAPAWIADVTKDTNFPRNRLVQDLGLKAAFAFPILVRREVAGVLEFFHTEKLDPDESILAVMHQVGVQLGRVVERRRAEQTLTRLVEGIEAKQGEDLLGSLVAHLAKCVKADYALVGELKEGREAVRTQAVWALGAIVPNFEYELAGTPCEAVAGKAFCSHPKGVQEKFPQDRMLVDMQVQGYMGTPLLDSTGRVLGLLAVLWRTPPANLQVSESMVQIFAIRAAAELDRKRTEATAHKLAEVPRASPHPVLEFSGDGVLRFCNTAAHVLARSLGKNDPLQILPADTIGIVKKSLRHGKNGLVVDTLADGRTIIWSFIPLVKNDSVFAHAFELTLFLDLHEELRKSGGVSREPHTGPSAGEVLKVSRPRRAKETIH